MAHHYVPLSEGTGFMVSQKPYELHLQSAFERQQVILSSLVSLLAGANAQKEVNMP